MMGSLNKSDSIEVFNNNKTNYSDLVVPTELLEQTGIKAIDFFCPHL